MGNDAKPLVAIIMGSISDWDTMQHAALKLEEFDIPYDKRVISAHRAPDVLAEYVKGAEDRGLKIFIAGAGCAAHLAGVTASMTTLPVLGVPLQAKVLDGMDSLLATVQMPAGIPVPTFAIGKAGAINAALSAVAIFALSDKKLADKLKAFRAAQTQKVIDTKFPD